VSLRIKAVDVAQVKDRPLFFDANVLLYLFSPVVISSNQWAINAYTAIFAQCLKMQSVLCIDVVVLSEFINTFLRIEYANYLRNNGLDKNKFNFKHFRSTTEGVGVAKDIEMVVKGRILKHFTIVGKLFTTPDISLISLANTDFNDALIVETCKEHQCILVTNDADFSGVDIDILTANNKLT
jgi:predicted nucleic acid-binding protein